MEARLYNYKQSPRKVRLVTDLVKGKRVSAALTELSFLTKRGALPIKKLIASAVANAVNNLGVSAEELVVKNIRVDKGVVMHRRMPRARGSAFPINKRTSHIVVTLATKEIKKSKKAVSTKTKESKAKKTVSPKKA